MDRRDFLMGSGSGLATLGLARPGGARDRRLRDRVRELRCERDAFARRTLARFDAGAPPASLDFARGVGALAAVDRLSRVPRRDQVHPAMQALIGELMTDVGVLLRGLPSLYDEALIVAPGVGAEHLRQLVHGLAHQLAEDDPRANTRHLAEGGFRDLLDEITAVGVAPTLERERRRLVRAWSLAEQMAGTETAALTSASPQLTNEVEAGEEEWGTSPPRDPWTALQILGLIGCGLGMIVGGYMVIVGVACLASCGGMGGLVIAMLGAALAWASISGIRAIRRRRLGLGRGRSVDDDMFEDDFFEDLPD